jgi:hypothetical protein
MTNDTNLTNTVALDKSLFGKTFTTATNGEHDYRFYSRIYSASYAMGWRWRNLIEEEKEKGKRGHNKLNAFLCVRLLREYLASYLADPDRDDKRKQHINTIVSKTIEEIYRRAE